MHVSSQYTECRYMTLSKMRSVFTETQSCFDRANAVSALVLNLHLASDFIITFQCEGVTLGWAEVWLQLEKLEHAPSTVCEDILQGALRQLEQPGGVVL